MGGGGGEGGKIAIQNLKMFISCSSFMGIRAPEKGSTKMWTKLTKLHWKNVLESWVTPQCYPSPPCYP